MDFQHKVAVVTGASHGIGQAVTVQLLAQGASVLMADIDVEAAQHSAARLRQSYPNCAVEAVRVNTKHQSDCFFMAQRAVDLFGRIDILVNCAGIVSQADSFEVTEDDWNNLIGINLSGVFFCSQAAGRVMKENGGGVILNMSSIGAEAGLPKRASYSAAKAGITLLTRTLAVEWAPHNIRINAVGPAWVNTSILQHSIEAGVVDVGRLENAIPLGRIASLRDVVEAVLFLASDKAAFITGQTLMVDGGYLAGAPYAAIIYAPSKSQQEREA